MRIALFALLAYILITPVSAEDNSQKESIFITSINELSYYGRFEPVVGYGFSLGYGESSAIGISWIYAQALENKNDITTQEFTVFLRLNIFGFRAFNFNPFTGPFIQLNTGIIIVDSKHDEDFPAESGTFSAGIAIGWRFLFGQTFFLEPNLRVGYPYRGSAGLSAGARF